MASGLHPTGRSGDAALVPTARYERVAGEMRGILRRTPESALHVHVGMPDGESAVRAFNALRRQVPLLLGLSANSPWWFGVDSGLASARHALVRAYPGRGIPEALRDLAGAEARVAAMLDVAGVPEPTFLWWDLRLHPAHGTIELREMDVQASLESSAALAALVRSLALEAQDVPEAPRDPSELLNWSALPRGARRHRGHDPRRGPVAAPPARRAAHARSASSHRARIRRWGCARRGRTDPGAGRRRGTPTGCARPGRRRRDAADARRRHG